MLIRCQVETTQSIQQFIINTETLNDACLNSWTKNQVFIQYNGNNEKTLTFELPEIAQAFYNDLITVLSGNLVENCALWSFQILNKKEYLHSHSPGKTISINLKELSFVEINDSGQQIIFHGASSKYCIPFDYPEGQIDFEKVKTKINTLLDF